MNTGSQGVLIRASDRRYDESITVDNNQETSNSSRPFEFSQDFSMYNFNLQKYNRKNALFKPIKGQITQVEHVTNTEEAILSEINTSTVGESITGFSFSSSRRDPRFTRDLVSLRTARTQRSTEAFIEDSDRGFQMNLCRVPNTRESNLVLDKINKRLQPNDFEFTGDTTTNLVQHQKVIRLEEPNAENESSVIPEMSNKKTRPKKKEKNLNDRSSNLTIQRRNQEENKEEHKINIRRILSRQPVPSVTIEEQNLDGLVPVVVNNLGVPTGETDPSLRSFYEPEVRIYLAKVTGFFLTHSLISLLLALICYSLISYEPILATIWIYLAYVIIIDTFWKKRILKDLWNENDFLYTQADMVSFALALLFILLQRKGALPTSALAFLPFLITAVMHLYSKYSFKGMSIITIKRLFVGLLILFIALKIDEAVSWEWHFILMPPWICLGIGSFYSFKYAFSFIKMISHSLRHRALRNEPVNILKLIGSFWYALYYGLSIVAILILLGVSQAYGPTRNFDLLLSFSFVSMGMGLLLLFFTLFKRKQIKQFIVTYGLIESLLARQEESKKPKKRLKLMIYKKQAYFTMTSSTYFVPLSQSFVNKEDTQRIKEKLRLTRTQQPPLYSYIAGTVIDVLTLKESREKLNKKLCKFEKIVHLNQISRQPQPLRKTYTNINNQREVILDKEDDEVVTKQSFSLNDLDGMRNINNIASSENKEEESLCYLCFSNQADAILVSCGHGGICHGCALDFIEKKDICLQCRKKVEGIYRIGPRLKTLNIVKATEFSQIIITES